MKQINFFTVSIFVEFSAFEGAGTGEIVRKGRRTSVEEIEVMGAEWKKNEERRGEGRRMQR